MARPADAHPFRSRGGALLQTHRTLALTGVGLLLLSVVLHQLWEPPAGSLSGAAFDGLTITGFCSVLSIAAEPWRRWRQARWRRAGPRGDRPDLDAAARQLRGPRGWARGTVLLAIVCAIAFSWSEAESQRQYDHLLEVGIRVPGTAIEVREDSRSPRFLDVEYELDGERHVTTFNYDTDEFEVGDPLTLLIDPEDHDHLTAIGIQRDSGVLGAANVLGMFGMLGLAPVGWLACRRVSIAGDLIVSTGWRRAHVRPWTSSVLRIDRDHVAIEGCTDEDLIFGTMPISGSVAGTGTYLVAGRRRGPVVLADGGGIVGIAHRRLVGLVRFD